MTKVFALSLLLVVGCDQTQQAASQQQPDYFPRKCECLELANKRHARDVEASAKRNNPDAYALGAEQCYVPTMNTCIYESGVLEVTSAKSIMTVDDLLTGHELANGNSDDPNYKRERDRLFALCAK